MKPTNNENIEKLVETIVETIKKKNHDYDNAFAEAYGEIGCMYAVGKIFEKYKRINTLSRSKGEVADDPLEDALKDCIGYCLLYLDQLNGEH